MIWMNAKPVVVERHTFWEGNEMVIGNKIDGVFREVGRMVVTEPYDRAVLSGLVLGAKK